MKNLPLTEYYPVFIERTARQFKNFSQQQFSRKGIRITSEQWSVLKKINEKEGINQKEIAEFTSKDPASVTRMLDTLENKRYVIRKITQNDRRTCALFLTDRGKKIVEKAMPVSEKVLTRGLEGVTEEELKEAQKILDKIFNNLI